MVHIQIYGHIPFFFILGRGLFQCPPFSGSSFIFTIYFYATFRFVYLLIYKELPPRIDYLYKVIETVCWTDGILAISLHQRKGKDIKITLK